MKKYEVQGVVPLDDRADAYQKSGDMVTAIARAHHHIDIDSLTQVRWREMMGLMREVDTWADDTDVTHEEVIEGLETFEMFNERYPSLTPEMLGEEAHEAMVRRAARVLKLGERVAQATTPRRFVALRTVEGTEATNLFEDIATAEVTKQPGFSEGLMPTLRALGEAATLWDSIIDGGKDYRIGKQILEPNAEYYARLTGAMLLRAKIGSAALLHVEPNYHLGVKVGKRVVNRIRNGVPEYSSLRTFSRSGTIKK